MKKIMKFLTCSFFLLGVSLACQSRTRSKAFMTALPNIPKCIQEKIDIIKRQPVWNPPAQVEEYVYSGKNVFLISARCCDFFNTAVDSACNYICAPSGGFTGKGDRKCIDFPEKAKYVRLVWKDERSKK